MDVTGYAAAWTRDEDLEGLNRRIHDGVPIEKLGGRARSYRDLMFQALYPQARPAAGDRVMEFGSGVGWIMEAMLESYPEISITGLDISENMVARARDRFPRFDASALRRSRSTAPARRSSISRSMSPFCSSARFTGCWRPAAMPSCTSCPWIYYPTAPSRTTSNAGITSTMLPSTGTITTPSTSCSCSSRP